MAGDLIMPQEIRTRFHKLHICSQAYYWVPRNGERKDMKKALLVSIILLSMLALTIVPVTKSATSIPNLKYSVEPIREQLVEAADFSSGLDPVGTYVPWDVDIINAEYPSNGGEGIYVAVIDTGLVSTWASFVAPTAHIDTADGRGWSYNVAWDPSIDDFDWTPNPARGFITDMAVGSGHGTHVTCEIVGYRRSTIGVAPHIVQGVAPGVTIIPILGLDTWLVPCPDPTYPGCHAGYVEFRGGDDYMLTNAIDYVASLAVAHPSWKIICTNSWGGSAPTPAIQASIDNAISKGVIFTFAAGNAGTMMDWPGAYPEVISCAAGGWTEEYYGIPPSNPPSPYRWYLTDVPEKLNTVDEFGNNWQIFLEDFSGRPNKALGQTAKDLDVCAPGAAVVGPYKPEIAWSGTAWVNYKAPVAYYALWGTSMATPHVAGVAAIIAHDYPQFNQADMEYVLKKAASMLPLASDTKYVPGDTVVGLGPYFSWTDHDYGSGWLTVDNALFKAAVYANGVGGPGNKALGK
jgi:subtilisin family serine protease